MSIETMSRVWKYSTHKGSLLLLLLAISDYADDNGFAFPGIETLAKKIRMDARHTRRLVAKLKDSGELVVLDKLGRVNLYIVKPGLAGEMYQTALKRAADFRAMREYETPVKMTGVSGDRGPRAPRPPDPSLNIIHDDDDVIMHDQGNVISALLERGWNAGEAKAAQFVETHGSPYILEICAHARDHKLKAGWIRKNAGTWQPSKNGNGDRERADRRRFIEGEYAAYISH